VRIGGVQKCAGSGKAGNFAEGEAEDFATEAGAAHAEERGVLETWLF